MMAYQMISEIAFNYHTEITIRESIEKILAILDEFLFLNMGRVLLPSHDQTKLYLRYAHGIEKEKRFISYDIDQGITGLIFSTKQPIYVDDLDTHSMYLGKLCETTNLPYCNPAVTGVPVFSSKNEIMGVLCVNHGTREARELDDIINLLENTATLISQLIKHEYRDKNELELLLPFPE
jgi:signal transduction protein with GAF and PtsI domain